MDGEIKVFEFINCIQLRARYLLCFRFCYICRVGTIEVFSSQQQARNASDARYVAAVRTSFLCADVGVVYVVTFYQHFISFILWNGNF